MLENRRRGWLLLAWIALAVGFTLPALADGEPALEAGFSVVDLTPDHRVPLGGYGARLGLPSTGVHDSVEARAMVLRQGETSLALVSLDLVGVSTDVWELVKRRVADLDLDEVVLAASHIHSGPGGLSDAPLWKVAMGRFDRKLYLSIVVGIEASIRAAYADLAPAHLRIGRADASGLSRNRATSGGAVDDSLGVVRIDAPDGRPRGIVVHHAAHGILVPFSERRLSAGWPGAMRRHLADLVPGATVLFLQGAGGDVSPVVPRGVPDETFARVDAYGEAVADAAFRGWEALAAQPAKNEIEVRGTTHAELFTVAGALLGRKGASALAPDRCWRLPVTRFRLGHVPIVTVPGEPSHEAGQQIAEWCGWTVGCAQGHFGYFADRDLFRRGNRYEAEMSFFGPDAAWRLRSARRRFDLLETARAATPPTTLLREPIVLAQQKGLPGTEHGLLLRPQIHELLRDAEDHIVSEAMRHGAGMKVLPVALAAGVSPRDLIVPMLVRAARAIQPQIPPEYLDEMENLAAVAGVPYDAILLENVFLTLAEQPDPGALLSLGAHCTNAVVSGEATSMGQLLHLSTLDWGMKSVLRSRTVTLVIHPKEGHPFVSVTWPGMVGTLRAMGAQGIAVTEESCSARDDTGLDGMPINFLIRQMVQHAGSLDEAVAMATETPGTCGYKITISDGRALDARVVEVTATRHHVRRPVGGMLFGCDPNAPPQAYVGAKDEGIRPNDGSSARRYPALRKLLEADRKRLRMPGLLETITTSEADIRGKDTLLATAFEPQTGRFWTSLGKDVDARLPEARWQAHDLFELLPRGTRFCYRPPWFGKGPGDVRAAVRIPDLAGVKIETIRFPSPVHSGTPQNDLVEAELFTPRDPIGVVIQLPHWKEPRGAPAQRLVAAALSQQGMAVLLLPLPYQYARAPKGVSSGAWTLSEDLARTREAAFQAAAEIYRIGLWLEEERGFPPQKQALLGTSLGGHIASLALGVYGDRFGGGVFLLAAADVKETLFTKNGVTDGVRRRLLERGVTRAEAERFLGDLDPARFARPEFKDRVLLIAGDADAVTPKGRVEALSKAWGGCRVHWFEGGHYGIVKHLPGVLVAVRNHLRERFQQE